MGGAGPQAGAGGAGGESPDDCLPARSAHPIPARARLLSGNTADQGSIVLVSELVQRFDAYCAGCHRAPASQGNFSYTTESFTTAVDARAAQRIRTEDAAERMPPSAPHPPTGDLLRLAELLELWIEQGRPSVTFRLEPTEARPSEGYTLTETIARGLTNLGHCIPRPDLVGTATDTTLDERFAAMQTFKDLPKTLAETDLFTLDTRELARHRTLAFAPTYQLWSYDAGKLRFVHVPHGETIQYDPAARRFVLPANTRFYKTFLKPVVDENGEVGWRKIETRLIVTRPDAEEDGRLVPRALFGTYIWNESETEATLLEKPYLGTPLDDPHLNEFTFKDLITTYVTDERAFREALESVGQGSGDVVLRPLAGTKEYPVPGWHRCVQCHQGSENADFSLGFTPIQLNRRPLGQGAVYEPAGEDELSQAQRFIDYGLISGVASADEFVTLEDSAGERKPRNYHELRAQAYMVGNCAHCHNPRGYPTQLNPSLGFFDVRPGGVVFQFPLDQRSPLRSSALGPLRYLDPTLSQRQVDQLAQEAASGSVFDADRVAVAPWGSLLYRNVQTPRTYDEGNVLFPHMPLHVAGMDCRAPEYFGAWNASIPFEIQRVGASELPVDSTSPEARELAERRVATFLAQGPTCQPAEDLRDWGAEAPAFTDLQLPRGIPDRPHWFEEDFTEVLGEFQPRGAKWKTALLAERYAFIRNFRATPELQAFVERDVPFDFWDDKPECGFDQAPPYSGPIAEWMEGRERAGTGDRSRVFSTLPGAAVFDSICANCHGPRGTGESNLASTIAGLTGGRTRVANFSQGLFGPRSAPTSNLGFFEREPLADGTHLGADGAAQYMMWMALGGTEVLIPDAALRQVAAAKIASQSRRETVSEFAGANMLEIAKEVCANTLQFSTVTSSTLWGGYDVERGTFHNSFDAQLVAVTRNGEYELYRQLCAIANPRPVRVVEFTEAGSPLIGTVQGLLTRQVFADYGASWSGDDENPWCLGDGTLYRPPGARSCPIGAGDPTAAAAPWIERGAANVGYAVYSYLKRAFADPNEWRPRFDQCELRAARD